MTIRDLVLYPDPRLMQECDEVTVFDKELQQLIDDMYETMYDAQGIGLAAPQIGVMKQIAVVDVIGDGSQQLEMINPVITASSGKDSNEEGCLSIPGYREKVTRPALITVTAQDRHGDEYEIHAGDMLSICMQHEIDHLHGVLFIDKISRLKKELFRRWFKKNEPLEV